MEIKTINKLKGLSEQANELMPRGITVNSKGEFYCAGEPLASMQLLSEIERVAELLYEMDQIIQAIKGRGQKEA